MIQRFLSLVLNAPTQKDSPIIYHESLGLIRDVEAHLVGDIAKHTPILGPLQRVIWLPTKFVSKGFGHKLQAFFTWLFISSAFVLVKTFLIQPDPILDGALTWACIICPVVLVMFPMPSVHAASGVLASDIQFSIDKLGQRGLDTKQRLTVVQQTLKVFEDRCKSRVNSLMWLVGIAWAGWTYIFVKGMEATIAGHRTTIEGMLTSALAFYAVLFLYIAVSGYESALNRLFRTIEIACSEMLLRDETASTESAVA